jgi:hypothetical protein
LPFTKEDYEALSSKNPKERKAAQAKLLQWLRFGAEDQKVIGLYAWVGDIFWYLDADQQLKCIDNAYEKFIGNPSSFKWDDKEGEKKLIKHFKKLIIQEGSKIRKSKEREKGIRDGKVDQDSSTWLGLEVAKADQGVKVTKVLPNTKAKKEGIYRGDIIHQVNDETIEDYNHFKEVLKSLLGSQVKVTLIRDEKTFSVTLPVKKPEREKSQSPADLERRRRSDRGLDDGEIEEQKPIERERDLELEKVKLPEKEILRVILYILILKAVCKRYEGQELQERNPSPIEVRAEEGYCELKKLSSFNEQVCKEHLKKMYEIVEEYERIKERNKERPREMEIWKAMEEILTEIGCIPKPHRFNELLKQKLQYSDSSKSRLIRRLGESLSPLLAKLLKETDFISLGILPKPEEVTCSNDHDKQSSELR